MLWFVKKGRRRECDGNERGKREKDGKKRVRGRNQWQKKEGTKADYLACTCLYANDPSRKKQPGVNQESPMRFSTGLKRTKKGLISSITRWVLN